MHIYYSCKKNISRVAEIAAMLCLLLVSQIAVYADDALDISSFNADNYTANIVVNDDNTFDYKETFVIDCSSLQNNEGKLVFYRRLNDDYKGSVSDIGVKGYDFEYDEEENVIKITVDNIGSNTTLAFDISYTLTGVDYMGEQEDELYLPMIDGAWAGAIKKASITIRYPETMEISELNYAVGDETGDVNSYGKWTRDEKNLKIKYSGRDIPANTKIELDAELPVGYWANSTSIGFTKTLALSVLLIGSLILILLKIIFGKESEISVSEEHYSPEGLPPAHIGYIFDGVVDNQDITSLFYFMAQKGYMTIEEYDRRKFEFEYLKAPKNETRAVRLLFDALFDKHSVGDIVKLEDRAEEIKAVNKKIKKVVPKDIFGGNKYFSAASKFANTLLWLTFAFVCAVIPFLNIIFIRLSGGQVAKGVIISVAVALGMSLIIERVNLTYYRMKRRMIKDGKQKLIIACIEYLVASVLFIHFCKFGYNGRVGDVSVMALCTLFLTIAPFMVIGMRARSKKNIYLMGRVIGLKEYMENATKSEIASISEKDPGYYYKLMPYALAFNISRKFAGSFEYVEINGPAWYKPYGIDGEYVFDIVIMNSMITNLHTELTELVYSQLDQIEPMVTR